MRGISNLIYFDNNATTRMDERVAQAMQNAGTTDADTLKQESLARIAAFINCKPQELFLTEGITPAIHIAIDALYAAYKHKGNHIITSAIEHAEVFKALDRLKEEGAEVTYLDVDREGRIDPQELAAAITPATAVVCIMAANNHTGVIQPVEDISEICHQKDIVFFSDASQYVGKMRTDVTELGMDSMVFGSHKMHGPDGIGVIYAKETTDVHAILKNTQYRSVDDILLLTGLAAATQICGSEHWDNSTHISKIKNYFEHQLLDIDGLRINGSTRYRLYNTSNLTFPAEKNVSSLLDRYKFLSYNVDNAHVLKAMGLQDKDLSNTFRFSFGKYNSMEEVQQLVSEIMAL